MAPPPTSRARAQRRRVAGLEAEERVADDDEPRRRDPLADRRGGLDEDVLPLAVLQPPDRHDHRRRARDAELGARARGLVARPVEPRLVDAVGDALDARARPQRGLEGLHRPRRHEDGAGRHRRREPDERVPPPRHAMLEPHGARRGSQRRQAAVQVPHGHVAEDEPDAARADEPPQPEHRARGRAQVPGARRGKDGRLDARRRHLGHQRPVAEEGDDRPEPIARQAAEDGEQHRFRPAALGDGRDEEHRHRARAAVQHRRAVSQMS
jgi:hypothetical protein